MRVVVVGAGHNGLVAAYYVARAGHEVTVLEAQGRPGGVIDYATVNGVKISRTAYVLGLMPRDMVRELGIELVEQDPYQVLYVDGKALPFWRDPERRRRALRQMGYEGLARLDEMLVKFREEVMGRFTYVTAPPTREQVLEAAERAGLGELVEETAIKVLGEYVPEEMHYFYIYPGMERSSAYVIAYYYSDWSLVKGGMEALVRALVDRATSAGARIVLGARVEEIVVRDGSVAGVRAGGRLYEADAVIYAASSVELPDLLPDVEEASRLRVRLPRASWAKHNLVLASPPRLPEPLRPYAGSIIDSECGELVVPSVADPTRGGHVAEFMGDYECVVGELLGVPVVYHDAVRASDAERTYFLPAGNVNHLPMADPYLFDSRPAKGWAYRTPVRGLYLGSSSAYPGGQITGLPGRNAAEALLEDARLGRLGR